MIAAPEHRPQSLVKGIKELEIDEGFEEDENHPHCIPTAKREKTGSNNNNVAADTVSPPSSPEPIIRIAWDSSSRTKKSHSNHYPHLEDAGIPDEVEVVKQQGNASFKAGDYSSALSSYNRAVDILKASSADATTSNASSLPLSILYSNISATYLRLNNPTKAVHAARQAHALRPTWPKALYRLAEAYAACKEYRSAVKACLTGEALPETAKNSQGHGEFTPLLDRLAVEAVMMHNSTAGFCGRRLEVRDAGEEAWLGRPAPHVPELDGPLTEETALPSDDVTSYSSTGAKSDDAKKCRPLLTNEGDGRISGTGASITQKATHQDSLSSWSLSQSMSQLVQSQRTSFRCIAEAMAAARDGDRIVLLRGTHNGMGTTVDINKRVLIEGEGELGETVIDQRANNPTFRCLRGGIVIRNLVFDFSGYREALLIGGGGAVTNSNVDSNSIMFIDHCEIKGSGDDGVHVSAASTTTSRFYITPTIRRCKIEAKKVGIKIFDSAKAIIEGCSIDHCGAQAIRVQEQGRAVALLSQLINCEEEGIVVMEKGSASVISCKISGNKGPGVDCSGQARCELKGGDMVDNVGGLFLWDDSSVTMEGVRVDGGRYPALLVDGQARLTSELCVIKGMIHCQDTSAWTTSGLLDASKNNVLEDPDDSLGGTDFPGEEGPFKFVPNPYTRKQ